jgi:hypothetical protein
MCNKLKTKTIKVDIYLSVWTEQYFEVPLDYEIKGSSSKEAYNSLSEDFEDQNPNAIYRPEYVELGDYNCDFIGLGDEFEIFNKETKEESIIQFDNYEKC